MLFFHESCTRLRAPLVTDKYRNRVRDWSNPTRLALTGVSIQPAGRAESHDAGDRDRADSGWTLQTRPGVDVDVEPTDRIELADGTVCEVVGEVARHPDPFRGGTHHVEIALTRTTG